MKLQVKFVKRNDCFISLPRSFASMLSQNYNSREIASIIKIKTMENMLIYLSYNGLISEKDSEIEISQIFATLNGLQDGDFVEVESENKQNTSSKFDLFCKYDDYEIINQKRNDIETSLLNSICVIFDKIRFPIYISQYNYVVLEFISTPDELNYYSINPQAEINIIPKNNQNSQNIPNIKKNENFLYHAKLTKLPKNFIDNNNFIYIHEKTFSKFNLVSNRPYFLNYKIIKHRNQLISLGNYLKKMENFSKKDNKKSPKILLCYIKPLPNDFFENNPELKDLEFGNYLYLSGIFLKSLNFPKNLPIKFDFSLRVTDFSKHRFCNIIDFINQKTRYNLYFFPVGQLTLNEETLKHEIANFLLDSFMAKTAIILYSGQLFKFKENFFAIRLLENFPDKKILLDMLVLEEKRAEIRITAEEMKNITKLTQEKIIIAKQQDFMNNFLEKTVNSYNIFVKKNFNDQVLNHKIDFLKSLFSKELEEMENFIINFFKTSQKKFMGNFNACLISGNSGNGKNSLIKKIKNALKCVNFEIIDFNEITNIKHSNAPPLDVIKGYVEGKIQAACLKEPSVVILDNLHSAAKNTERIDFQQSHEILVSEVFAKFVKDLIKKYKNIAFIAICDNRDFLNNQFNGVFVKEWNIKLPTFAQRKKIFEEIGKHFINFPFENIEELATLSDNFNLRNLDLINKRCFSLRFEPKELVLKNFLDNIKNISNKTYKSNRNYPKFEHIGGLHSAKELIRDTFEIPQKFDFLFKNIPIKMSNGILLYGPPGCGKTFIAAAAANELGMNFFSVKGPELLNKYIGASEQAVREIFEKATNVKPSIVFFDEFDAIVPRRNSGSTNVTDRVVNQFLCYLDGVSSLQGVYILAASSRPDLIDPALLRPGRIDKHIYLGFPDQDDRKRILDIYYKNFKFEDINEQEISEKTHGFTASDLVALLREMQITKAHNILEKVREDPNQQLKDFELKFCREDFDETLKKFKPALSEKDIKRYEKMYADFVSGGVDIKKQKTTLY